MRTNHKESLNAKPVVIVRKKARTQRSPTGPTTATPGLSAPLKTAATRPASPPPGKLSPAAPVGTASGPNKKERERHARRELLALLCDRWPGAFPREARRLKPLALGIRQDLAAHLPAQPPGRIGFVIGLYQQLMRPAYWRAVVAGGPRYDLEGKPRGEVTAAEQEHAGRALHACYEQRKNIAAPRAPSRKRVRPILEEAPTSSARRLDP